MGQLGHGGEGVVHGLADSPADAAELHVLILGAGGSHGGGRGGCGGGSLSGNALGHQFTHIPLDNPAVGAGGGGQGAVHPGALGQVPGPGGDFSRARGGGGLNGLSSHRSGSGRDGGCLLGGGGGRGRAVGPQGGHVLPLGADGAHVHQTGDLLAVAEENLQQLAGGGGLTLKGGLVRLIGEQDIALGDLVAHLLLPLADDTGLHCDARLGHQDCVCHDHSS